MQSSADLLAEIRDLIARHAGQPVPVDGLRVSRIEAAEPDHSLTEPLLVLAAQGGKRLMLGDQVHEYRAGQILLATATMPVTGHYIDTDPRTPMLAMGLTLRPAAIAPLLLEAAGRRPQRGTGGPAALIAGDAGPELLDPIARLLRLLDRPADIAVLAPLAEREILWRLVTGPYAAVIRQIGLPDSGLSHVSRAIRWIRDNYAEPVRVADLAGLSGMSPSAFHRNFRAITAMSPVQFQKRIRLQEARSLLMAEAGDVAGVGHVVGYDSPTQFSREYRRLFGAPPGTDAARLRAGALRPDRAQLP
ncbi:MAG TPA: AraC family transcriptional regulator [Streptosporangiaceae bacterium]|jgi:AraC-like DNA-binding protein